MSGELKADSATLDTIANLVIGALNVKQCPGGDPFVIVPPHHEVKSLAHLLPPTRIQRRLTLLDAGSFADYVNRFKTEDTLIFANVTETSATFTAMLDYHGAAPNLKPARCEHTAVFATINTPEWKVWMEANRKPMDQVAFATWIEDNLRLFVSPQDSGAPTGAELLELVKSLHGHSNARFNTALRLNNGAYSVAFEEDVAIRGNPTTTAGDMELPAEIVSGIAPFMGGPPYEVHARLKTRVQDRKLVLWFETIAVPNIVRDSILALVNQIAEKTTIIPLLGNP